MIRVAVVDDDNLVREALVGLLEKPSDIEVVSSLETGSEAISFVQNNAIDVLVLDLNLPDLSGYEVTKRLKSKNPKLKVVILTVNRSLTMPRHLLKAGATAFLTKGCDFDELLLAIRMAVANRNYICRELSQLIAVNLQTFDQSPFEQLSSREMEIVTKILQGMRLSDIAEQLFLSPKTISTHRSRAYEKLSVGTDMELFKLALQHHIIEI